METLTDTSQKFQKPENNSSNGQKPTAEFLYKPKVTDDVFLTYGIPNRYLKTRFSDLEINSENKNLIETGKQQAEDFWNNKPPQKGIFSFGKVGTGKSTVNYCIAKAAIQNQIKIRGWIGQEDKTRYGGEKSPYELTNIKFRDLLQETIKGFKTGNNFIKSLSCLDFVFIDDMTVNTKDKNQDSIYRWANEAMNQLIDNIWDKASGAIYITSNNSASELADIFGDAFMDRVRGMTNAFETNGKSYR